MGLRQRFSPSRSQTEKTRGSTPAHEKKKTRHDKDQDDEKERQNLFESGQCRTALSGHDQDGLLLPQTSHAAFIDQYHSSPYQQSPGMVQIEVPSAPNIILHDDGQAVVGDDPAVVQDPRTVEMDQRSIDQKDQTDRRTGRVAHRLAIGQPSVASRTRVRRSRL